jgi:hypothetical protein
MLKIIAFNNAYSYVIVAVVVLVDKSKLSFGGLAAAEMSNLKD